MAITLVGGAILTAAVNSGGDPTITLPGDIAENDYVLVFGAQPRTGHANNPMPSGYTQLLNYDDGVRAEATVAGKFMGATPDATCVVEGTGSATDAMVAVAAVLRGVDLGTPSDATPTTNADTDGGSQPDPASIVVATAGAWVFAFGERRANTAAPTSYCSGYSNGAAQGAIDTNRQVGYGCRKEVSSPGTEDPGAYAFASSTETWLTITVAIRPAAAGGGLLVLPSPLHALIGR